MTTWRCSRFILVNGSWCRKAKGADGQQRTVETGESRRTNTGDRIPGTYSYPSSSPRRHSLQLSAGSDQLWATRRRLSLQILPLEHACGLMEGLFKGAA